MESRTRINPVIHFPPPLMFLVTFFAGTGLQYLDPLRVPTTHLVKDVHYVGIGMVGFGVVIAALSFRMFILAHTTLLPYGTATALLTQGPFRFTRNPLYLSLVITYLGAVAIFAQLWSLLLLPIPVAVIQGVFIPSEEARLRETFGRTFIDYCARVRRWL